MIECLVLTIRKFMLSKIVSKDNEKIKFLRKLNQKKYREKYNKFFVENINIIHDALKAGFIFSELYIAEELLVKKSDKLSFILKNTEYYIINGVINKSFSNLSTPSGICAVYDIKFANIDFKKPIIYLNNINDPGNLGTILRCALAFSLTTIVLDENCVDLYNPKTISSARDAIFKLNIVFDKDLKILKEISNKMKIFSTDLEASDDIDILNNKESFCLVFGNEAHGVDQKIKDLSFKKIKIKMSEEIESLNVASSAAIIFHNFFINNK